MVLMDGAVAGNYLLLTLRKQHLLQMELAMLGLSELLEYGLIPPRLFGQNHYLLIRLLLEKD